VHLGTLPPNPYGSGGCQEAVLSPCGRRPPVLGGGLSSRADFASIAAQRGCTQHVSRLTPCARWRLGGEHVLRGLEAHPFPHAVLFMTSSSRLRCLQARGRGSVVESRDVSDGARAASNQAKRAAGREAQGRALALEGAGVRHDHSRARSLVAPVRHRARRPRSHQLVCAKNFAASKGFSRAST
jgi:hypothetical protein